MCQKLFSYPSQLRINYLLSNAMIKTELKPKTKPKQRSVRRPKAKRQWGYPAAVSGGIIIILAISGYLYLTRHHQQPPAHVTTHANSSGSLPVSNANTSSGNQATTTASSNLTSGSVNLQNNTSQPSGFSGSNSSNLQNTTPIPSTSYIINVN